MRRGKFGRNRGGSPNLTALIASLMREQRAAEDKAIFDAYQNGGLYKGKPVTDGVILGYIKGRRDGFDKADPLYDQWNNTFIQTTFSIGEQKIGLAFKQGHASAGAVAAWYRGQLSKLPKNSAFYREVAGRAADWAKAAGGAARGRAHSKLTAGLKGKQAAVQKLWAQYGAVNGAVVQALQREGVAIHVKADGTVDWGKIDATAIQDLFAGGSVIVNGHRLTYADWQKTTNDAYHGFDTLIAVNNTLKRGVKTLTKDKNSFFEGSVIALNTIDDRAKAEIANSNFGEAVSGAQNDPAAVLDAIKQYKAQLGAILAGAVAGTGPHANDSEFIGTIQNELDAANGKTANGDGLPPFDAGGHKVTVADILAGATHDGDLLASGKGYYGQEKPGDQFHVVEYNPLAGTNVFGPHGGDKSFQDSIVSIDGETKLVTLKGQPVNAVALKDKTGAVNQIPDGKGGMVTVADATPDQIRAALQSGAYDLGEQQSVGYIFANPDGKVTYAVKAADGSLVFTDSNPFGATYNANGSSVVVLPGQVGQTGLVEPVYNPQQTVDNLTNNGVPTSNLLVDPTVSPADLRDLASKSADQTTAQKYLDAATAQENRTYSRSNYYDSHNTTSAVEGISHALDQGAVGGTLGEWLNKGLGALGDAVRVITAPPAGPPVNTGRPPAQLSPPDITTNTAANALGTVAGSALSGAVASLTQPPPPVAPTTSGAAAGLGSVAGAAAAAAAAAALKPPPVTTPGGGGGRKR